jgi:hypothetical protein
MKTKLNIDNEGNEYCFSYMPDGQGGFKIVKLYKGVKGYGELSKLRAFLTEEAVREMVRDFNRELGLSYEDEMRFIAGAL